MGLREQHWDNRSQSPYLSVSDADEKKVMDLSNYGSSSPVMVCCGSPVPDTVLRLGVHQSPTVSSGRSSASPPLPSRTVITSVASFYHQNSEPASSPSPSHHHHHQHHHPHQQQMYYLQNGGSGGSPLTVPSVRAQQQGGLLGGLSGSTVAAATSSRKKKLPQPIPEDCKDDAYWERRKRNNESAKRSRELRRNKEMATTERVNFLESENLQLRTEVTMLRNEVEKLRQLLIPRSAVSS